MDIFLHCVEKSDVIILHLRHIRVPDATAHVRRLSELTSRDSQKQPDAAATKRRNEELTAENGEEHCRVTHLEYHNDVEQILLHLDQDLNPGENYRYSVNSNNA